MAEEIDFNVETQPCATSRTLRYSPINGTLNSAIISFPASNNIEVRIYVGTTQILPAVVRGGTGDTGLSFNNATLPFSLHKFIRQNEPIELVVENTDGQSVFLVRAVVQIDETQRYTGG